MIQRTGNKTLDPPLDDRRDEPRLAQWMLATGLRVVLTCVDPKQLSERFVGRQCDERLLGEPPAEVDPCGDRGEFHTFCFRCPEPGREIPVTVGEVVERDGFWYTDLRRTVLP
jgi:diphthamide synthase (EF-2-diphthine--ammonia ligase)